MRTPPARSHYQWWPHGILTVTRAAILRDKAYHHRTVRSCHRYRPRIRPQNTDLQGNLLLEYLYHSLLRLITLFCLQIKMFSRPYIQQTVMEK